MYSPVQDGMDKSARPVRYTEAKPPSHLSGSVHCFWELKTLDVLDEDFCLHALPDACVNILFNQLDTQIAGVTALRTKAEALNLGRTFHYVGIQFFPGVWQGLRNEIADQYVGSPYVGTLPLVQVNSQLAVLDFQAKVPVLSQLTEWFMSQSLVVHNPVTEKILNHIETIRTVEDMAAIVNLSPRQLQRTLARSIGFSPHDLLKVLRLQRSFKEHYLDLYADQSHFVHSFRKITGYTPAKYSQKFDV
jgi:AraC-like DNA-binding protein